MASNQPKDKVKPVDLIHRGIKRPSPVGTLTFVGLRALDPFLQYQILAKGWGVSLLSKLGLATIPAASTAVMRTGIAAIDSLNLSLPRLILVGMAAGSALKQIIWLVFLSKEEFPLDPAIPVSIYNTVVNTTNALLFTSAATSAALSVWPTTVTIPGVSESLPLSIVIGTAMYAVGMVLELGSEIQRKRFKDDPANSGKLCRSGMWSWARHINYGGYTLWRAGYGMAGGSWLGGLLMGGWHFWNFMDRSVISMDDYMSGRYKEQWTHYKRDVNWLLLPGIY